MIRNLDINQSGIILAASVSCMDMLHLKRDVERVNKSSVSFLHFDVVDGRFNECFILGTPTLQAIKRVSQLPIEVHLAVYEPDKYLALFREAGADYITVQYEADTKKNLKKTFGKIRALGAVPVLALKAQTDVDDGVIELAKEVPWILKLTVNPGFSGQQIQPEAYEKIRALKKELIKNKCQTRIQSDGNMNGDTIPKAVAAGADIITGGTSGLFIKGKSIKRASSEILLIANKAREKAEWGKR